MSNSKQRYRRQLPEAVASEASPVPAEAISRLELSARRRAFIRALARQVARDLWAQIQVQSSTSPPPALAPVPEKE